MLFEQTADTQVIKQFVDQLIDYNHQKTAEGNYQTGTFNFVCKDDQGIVSGLIMTEISFNWMYIAKLIVDKNIRTNGVGSFLLGNAEDFARSRGCHSVWLFTSTFQAPDFYKKMGYKKFGTLKNYPGKHKRYFLCKQL